MIDDFVSFELEEKEIFSEVEGGGFIKRSLIEGGVRVLSEYMPNVRSVSIGIWFPSGSVDEQEESNVLPASLGSTHFLEHLLFKGTTSSSAFDLAIKFDEIGSENNALTAKEYTCYYAKVRDVDLEVAIDNLVDMVCNSVLDNNEFDIEKQVILEELAMADDDLSDVAAERLAEAVYGNNSLSRPIGGTQKSITESTREAVWAHYVNEYRSQNMIITAAGNVDHDFLLKRISDVISKANDSSRWSLNRNIKPNPRRKISFDSSLSSGSFEIVSKQSSQMNIMLGYPALVLNDDRRFVMSILNTALGGSMSSRLFQEIREKRGLAYSTYSFSSSYSSAGMFGMYVGCSADSAMKSVTLMQDALKKVADGGLSDIELKRTIGQLTGSAVLALEDSDTRMNRLGKTELGSGIFYDLSATLRQLDRVTSEQVSDLAVHLLNQPMSLVAVGDFDTTSNLSRDLEKFFDKHK